MQNIHIITQDSIVIILHGEVFTIKRDRGKIFDRVVEAVEAGNYDEIPSIVSPKDLLDKVHLTFDENTGQIFFEDYLLKTNLTDRIYQYWENEVPYEPLLNLLRKIMSHKKERSYMQEDLFDFLEYNDLPITEDGCFLAYKNTNSDGSPPYQTDSNIRYEVGKEVVELAAKDNYDRGACNGAGLYFGNRKYWGSNWNGKEWGGNGRMFLVKIDPRDVVSIPNNYNDGKAKCWKLKVVKEFTHSVVEDIFGTSRVSMMIMSALY
jgi:hypothetical protein